MVDLMIVGWRLPSSLLTFCVSLPSRWQTSLPSCSTKKKLLARQVWRWTFFFLFGMCIIVFVSSIWRRKSSLFLIFKLVSTNKNILGCWCHFRKRYLIIGGLMYWFLKRNISLRLLHIYVYFVVVWMNHLILHQNSRNKKSEWLSPKSFFVIFVLYLGDVLLLFCRYVLWSISHIFKE